MAGSGLLTARHSRRRHLGDNMSTHEDHLQREALLTRRRLGLAGILAFAGCAACCAIPLLAAAGIGSGAVATLASVLRPGLELVVGGGVFALALATMLVLRRRKRRAGCGSSCSVDGRCCERGTPASSA
jgi:hypothetical protein